MHKNSYTGLLSRSGASYRERRPESRRYRNLGSGGGGRGKLKHRWQLHRHVEGRELLEVAEAFHGRELAEAGAGFLRKQVAELACQTGDEPGQARLVEKLFGIATGLQELEEEIRKVREERTF